jgi:enoyl-CoA hydratase/carnithine racemase
MTIADRIASGPTQAFAIAKELLNQSAGMDRLGAHLDRELDELTRVADGPEFAEGLKAFFEKRTAAFNVEQRTPNGERAAARTTDA